MNGKKYKLDMYSHTEKDLLILLRILKFEIDSYLDYDGHKNGTSISSVDRRHKSKLFKRLKILLKIRKNIIYHLKLKSNYCKECIEDHGNPKWCIITFGGWCDKKMKG